MIFPLMTLVFGPFLPQTLYHYDKEIMSRVNLIWDPIYSFGWMFVGYGTGSRGYRGLMALVALLLGVLVFCIIVVIGYKIGKSRIRPMVKWLLFINIVVSFFVTMPWQAAENLQYLHFTCFHLVE